MDFNDIFDNYQITVKWFYKNGKLHREDSPARIIYFNDENHRILQEEYYKDGL